MTDEFVATIYNVDNFAPGGEVDTLVLPEDGGGISWTEPISEAGSGEVVLLFDTPQPVGDQLVYVTIKGEPAFTFLTRDVENVMVSPGGQGKLQATHTMPGHLAVMEDALVYPCGGLQWEPKQVDMHLDWRHPLYNDATADWVAPTVIASLADAQAGTLSGSPWGFLPWASGLTANGMLDTGNTKILGPSSGDTVSAPPGTCYLRGRFSVGWDGVFIVMTQVDNTIEIYIDDVFIGAWPGGSDPYMGGWFTGAGFFTVTLSAGEHVIAVKLVNWSIADNSVNPVGFSLGVWTPGFETGQKIFETGDPGWLINEYPDAPPGMTYGNAIRLVVEKAQSYNEIPWVSLGFSDTQDSNSEDWAVDGDSSVLPCISTRCLNDILTFLRESSATYGDVRMDPESFELRAFNKDTMNATPTGLAFVPANDAMPLDDRIVTGLIQRKTYRRVSAVVGEYQGGYLEVTTGANPRRSAQFQIGSVDTVEEAYRVLSGALADFVDPREEISVQVDGPTPYVDYQLGQTATAMNAAYNEVGVRIGAITVTRTNTGRARGLPKLQDVFV